MARRPLVVAITFAAAALAYDPSASASSVKSSLALLCALTLLALSFPTWLRGDRPVASRAGVAWLTLCGLMATSLWWSDHPRPSLLAPYFAGAGLTLFATGLDPTQRRRFAGRVATMVAAGSAATCLAQALAGGRGSALHGLHANPNWLGLVLACSLPLVLDLHQRLPRHSAERWGAAATLALTLPALVLSQARVAWLGLVLAVLVCGKGRHRFWLLLPLGAALAWMMAQGDLLQAWQGRLWIWRASAQAGMTAPLAGHGAGSFPFVFLEAQGGMLTALPLDQAAVRFSNATTAHNDWLQLWVEGGLLAPLLLTVTLGLAFWDNRKQWRAGAAVALVIASAALGDAPLTVPAVLVVLAPVLAAGVPLPPRRIDALASLLVVVACALLLSRTSLDWLTERRLSHARQLLPVERLAMLTRASRAAPHHGEAELALALMLLESGQPTLALPHLARSSQHLANASTQVAKGNAHLALGHTDAAVASYQAALRLHPASLSARVNLSETYRAAGQLEAAETQLAAARDLWPHHAKVQLLSERLRKSRIEAAEGGR